MQRTLPEDGTSPRFGPFPLIGRLESRNAHEPGGFIDFLFNISNSAHRDQDMNMSSPQQDGTQEGGTRILMNAMIRCQHNSLQEEYMTQHDLTEDRNHFCANTSVRLHRVINESENQSKYYRSCVMCRAAICIVCGTNPDQ